MNLNETLVARWIAEECVASGLFEKENEAYVFIGDENDFKIEIKAFKLPKTVRLGEN